MFIAYVQLSFSTRSYLADSPLSQGDSTSSYMTAYSSVVLDRFWPDKFCMSLKTMEMFISNPIHSPSTHVAQQHSHTSPLELVTVWGEFTSDFKHMSGIYLQVC